MTGEPTPPRAAQIDASAQRDCTRDADDVACVTLRSTTLKPLVHQFAERVRTDGDRVAFAVYPSGATAAQSHLSWHEWNDAARAVASSLIAGGVAAGDRVAVISRNRPLWPITDIAIQMAGATGVGIYQTSAPIQIEALLVDCGASLIFVDSIAHAAVVLDVRTRLDRAVVIVCDVSVDEWAAHPELHVATAVRFDEWRDAGSRALSTDRGANEQLDARIAAVTLDDLAALIYTSGSTGEPKGACISHRYLAASAESIVATLTLTADDRALSFLPFSHAAERVFGQCTRVLLGMTSALIEDPADVFRVAQDFEPTFFGGLPRIFERLFEAADVARRDGADARAAIVSRIGSRCRLATSGGAALPRHVGEFLQSLGLPIIGAYGQTEHLCVAMNRLEQLRFDSVGPPMPGTEVRIAEGGELLLRRSELTFDGYWQKPDATRDAFTSDGQWLRTGDRAEQDSDGSLRITGRVKELIALSNGRKIAPLPIEATLTASPFIAHAVCHGEGRKYLVALLSLRRDVVEAWAREERVEASWPVLAQHAALRERLQEAVDDVNATLARSDRIQSFAVTDREFTLENGELTPTLKLIRNVIAARFAETFDRMYA